MTWAVDHLAAVADLTWRHFYLVAAPLVIGLVLAVPLGWLAWRYRRLRSILVTGSGLLYTVPSLAVFVLLPGLIGTRILDPVNVIVAMTLYTLALLVRTVVDGLESVSVEVRLAATAMGYRGARRLLAVELPLAIPVITAGLRVAAVSNVSVVSVAALIGVAQLGSLFTDGFARGFLDPIVVGLIACVALALVFDLAVVLAGHALTPWLRAARAGVDR